MKANMDYNDAIQELIAITEAKRKRNFGIKTIIIWAVFAIVAIVLVVEASKSAYNGVLRNIATDVMDDAFTNVYADVIFIEPTYTVEETKYKRNLKIGSPETSNVICNCTTVEGTTFWLMVPAWYYSGTIEYRGTNSTGGFDEQYFDEPIRLHGHMTTFKIAVDNAPANFENTLLLSIYGDSSSID